mgnify:CR=1 FL=1
MPSREIGFHRGGRIVTLLLGSKAYVMKELPLYGNRLRIILKMSTFHLVVVA